MKSLFIYMPVDLNDSKSGISRKCKGMIEAFKEKYIVDVLSESDGKVFFNDKMIKDNSGSKINLKYYYYSEVFLGQYYLVHNIISEKKYDIAFIRLHYFVSPGLIRLLNKLKKSNPKIKIQLELPTYPFETEMPTGPINKLKKTINKWTIPQLHRFVDKIITFSNDEFIWNIPTITISNAYYNPQVQNYENNNTPTLLENLNKAFHLCMVARFAVGHAPELIVQSVINYYSFEKGASDPDVYLHLIGKGEVLLQCQEMVNKKNLQNNVIFHGELKTEEILDIMNSIHICVGTMGMNRKNILIDSSLKTREYVSMGKPVILRTKDLDFSPSLFFVKYFPEIETVPRMNEIIQFYKNLVLERPDFYNEIRDFAKRNLSWKNKLKEVFEYYDK